jgi:curved DNA-binding protein CbpA
VPDPFALLGLAPRHSLSAAELRSAWMRRAAAAHPDANGGVDESAALNDAYRLLSDPIARALALLELRGAPAGDDRALPPGFLLELVELRERVDACGVASPELGVVRGEVVELRARAIAEISESLDAAPAGGTPLDASVAQAVRTAVNVVRSYDRVLEQLDREAGGEGSAAGGSGRP